MHSFRIALLAALSSAVVASAATTISSLPYNITSPGSYVLGTNLTSSASSGSAIRVRASNVTLDLNGYQLKGAGYTSGTDTAIRIDRQKNVVVRNGNIQGFSVAIGMENTQVDSNHRFQDLNLYANGLGMLLTGINHVVRNVQISNPPGMQVQAGIFLSCSYSVLEHVSISGNKASNGLNVGIRIWGWNNRIRSCQFSAVDYAVFTDNYSTTNGTGNSVEESYFADVQFVHYFYTTPPRIAFVRNTFSNCTTIPELATGASTNIRF